MRVSSKSGVSEAAGVYEARSNEFRRAVILKIRR